MMTMRERMLAVVQGRPFDRVPFVQYNHCGGPDDQVQALLGRDRIGLLAWVGAAVTETPNCRVDTAHFEADGRRGYHQTLHTPAGSLTQTKLVEPALGSAATHAFYIQQPEDYRVLLAYLRDTIVRPNLDGVAGAMRQLGEDGLPHVTVGRTPYQQLWVEWVSLQDLSLHLVDEPVLMGEVVAALGEVQHRIFAAAVEVARQVPIPWLVFPDNVTAPTIGERYFRQYCLPAYQDLADLLAAAGLDLPIHNHMDGDLRPLWSAIRESPIRGLDSLSPPPDNDTSVADALALKPDLRAFPNFPSSVHLASPEAIHAKTWEMLDQGAASGRLWIQISENVPPGRWRVSYPAIAQAIDDWTG